MVWKIKFKCQGCNKESEILLKFAPKDLNTIEGIGRAIAESLVLHSKEVKLVLEEGGKVREIRF